TLSSDELRDLLGDDEKLDERVNEASEKNNAETVLALLQTAAAESEEESEKIVKQLLDSELTVDAYVEQFMHCRKLMHSRKLNAEKMTELLRSNRHNTTSQRFDAGYGPASMPYPSSESALPGGFYMPPGMAAPSTAVPYPMGPPSMPMPMVMFRPPPF
uniref:VPS37 C-terminal domain-containing protein n=1 Tax=Anopheles maculatus TaxID=74869 RepID=A0A182SH27_9DIPT